mmetsp:Transcript_18599/g.17697  ORF Transcript_18599/g.17697 Transcript_18599/m.17697 type:complete len:144 (-) Transcript_18599:1486-1917(-)
MYILGQQKQKVNNWRPTGRLITTLYEHRGPVNCLAVADDSSMFVTGSKKDNSIHIWSTSPIEKDITSHSLFSLETTRGVNGLTFIENSNYFAAAGDKAIDIYQVGRLEQENQMQQKGQGVFRNTNIDKNLDFNYSSIIRTLEH